MTVGDVVYTKDPIFELRKQNDGWMEDLTNPLKQFINDHKFYPKVFYNENDINHPQLGIRAAIPDLDDYSGVFVVQDAPDTPIAGFKGIEFRTSITDVIRSDKQLLWTNQDFTNLKQLPHSDYNEDPSVQFVGTVVFMNDGRVFPQQLMRHIATTTLGTSGLLNRNYVLYQQFQNGKFVELRGTRLSQEDYFNVMNKHPYGLSVRGWGNWNVRFYELLASGRIPVHVHSGDELLFEDWIDYDEYIVRVRDVNNMVNDVRDFHSQFSDNRTLHAHQDKLVKLYHDYLSYPAFVRHFEEYYGKDLSE